MAQQQQQMANNEVVQQVQIAWTANQMLMQNVETLQNRANSEDEQRQQEELRYQGYQQGVAEAKTLTIK